MNRNDGVINLDSNNRIYLSSEFRRVLDVVKRGKQLYFYHDERFIYITNKLSRAKELEINGQGIEIYYRKFDSQHRVRVPYQLRKMFQLVPNTQLFTVIHPKQRAVAFKRYDNACHICGRTNKLKMFAGLYLCETCHSRFM